jgi:hypothetical protein
VRLGGLLLSSAYAEVYVDSASSVEIGSARNVATGAITVEAGNTVAATGSADLSGDIVDSGTISETGGGTLTLDGALSGSGQVQIGANSTLDMNGVAGAGDTIAFTGSAATMTIGSASTYNFSTNSYTYTPYAVSATLSGFATGDGIIVPNSEVETTPGTVVSSSALTNAVYTYAGNNTDSRPVFRQLRGRKPHPRRQLHRPHLLHQPDHQRRKRRHLAGPARPTVPSNEAVLVGVTTPLTGFSVTDPNAQATGITVTPTGTNGQLSATNAAGGTVTGSGTNDLVISGSLAQANGDLAPLTYLSNAGERHDQPECGRFDGQHRIAGKRPGYRYTGGPSGDHGNGVLAANTAAPGGGMIA